MKNQGGFHIFAYLNHTMIQGCRCNAKRNICDCIKADGIEGKILTLGLLVIVGFALYRWITPN